MTARSRERGSHAGRPRNVGLPFTVRGLPSAPPPQATPPAPAPPRPSRGQQSRHRKPAERRSLLSKRGRLGVALVLVGGVLTAGFLNGFGGAGSAEPTVASFLLDWQTAHYAAAAALTNDSSGTASTELAAAYTDLNATSEFLSMSGVTQHGSTAVASFTATVDLAQAGQQWTYTGRFGLSDRSGHWVIDWAPSVINPRLSSGDRLAVETSYAPRASVLGMDGQPLLTMSPDVRIGVYPGKLKNQAATAVAFSKVSGLDEQQVLGWIQSAPPGNFLPLLTLDPAGYAALWPKLSKVPGIMAQHQQERLFSSAAQEVVGQVGAENSALLREEGAAYQPGMTVGLTGLEQVYQSQLVGTPTTSIVVVNAAGRRIGTLWSSPGGHAGTPVQTTISLKDQDAATSALAAAGSSGEIVALDTSTGQVRALASRQVGNQQLPAGGALNAKIQPGMAFSIVSASALLSNGVSPSHLLPCEPVVNVGGVTFTYSPATSSTSTLSTDFANGCGTAFANMSRTLTAQQFASAERSFGIGASWQMKLSSFSGSAPAVSSEAAVAAQSTGAGGVLVSPIGMAAVAAEVASGTGRSPVLMASEPQTTWQAPLTGASLQQLRLLMRLAVVKGAAQAANVPGTPVYGQAGVVKSASNSYLSWFVGYRGSLAVAVLETGSTASQAAAALAGAYFNLTG